jgi:hypothetical protein
VAVISASTTKDIDYKELYNSVDFNTTMLQVQRFFLNDNNTSLTGEPLFLIFRIQSDIQSTYDSVAYSITQVFGVGNHNGNFLYNKALTVNTTLADIQNTKVIIIVQPFSLEKLENSSLKNIASYTLNPDGITAPYINRISDNITNLTNNDIHFLYPNLYQSRSINYDPTEAFTQNITFIAMNFQKNDSNLKKYNTKFGKTSFIKQ